MTRNSMLAFVGLQLLCAMVAFSSTIHVPAEQPTIQAGINASTNGDTVLVAPGIYRENISFIGKTIALLSDDGPDVTFLYPLYSSQTTILIINGEGLGTEMSGFTIAGDGFTIPLRIYNGSSPIISNNIFCDNITQPGGNVEVIQCLNSSPEIKFNLFYNNKGIACIGIRDGASGSIITNNTFDGNQAGIHTFSGGVVVNNIITNSIDYGVKGAFSTLDYNDIWNNSVNYMDEAIAGDNDLSIDPLYLNRDNHIYALSFASQCINTGSAQSQYNDPDGTRNDIGVYPTGITNLPLPLGINTFPNTRFHVVESCFPFNWSYYDNMSQQIAYEIQVGTDNDWSMAEMWATGGILSSDTSASYNGIPMRVGASYLCRIRLRNSSNWGGWKFYNWRMNSAPTIPIPAYPTGQLNIVHANTRLAVYNSSDAENDPLEYEFEIYDEQFLSNLLYSDTIVQQNDSTMTEVISGLINLTEYWWRSRSFDGFEYSQWSNLESFIIKPNVTIHIPDDQPTIQAGLEMAENGDTIIVLPGIYSGTGNRDMLFYGKSLLLKSQSGPQYTIIDCQGTDQEYHRAINFSYVEDSTSIIDGFTIINGFCDNGGAIYCKSASPHIQNCIFRNNKAHNGGAIYGGFPDFIIDNCIFENDSANIGGAIYGYYQLGINGCIFAGNQARYSGSAVYAKFDSEIRNCTFHENNNSAISITGLQNSHIVEKCLFYKNATAIAAASVANNINIYNCTIVQNDVGVYAGEDALPELYNCIIAYNSEYGCDCYYCGWDCPFNSQTLIYNCDVFENGRGWWECITDQVNINGNMSLNPLFCDTTDNDYYLAANSPCLGAGANSLDIGAFGIGCVSTGVDDDNPEIPLAFKLSQNYPNPFNPTTTFKLTLPVKDHVSINVFDLLGRKVVELYDGPLQAGVHAFIWNGLDRDGKESPSGIYFYRATTSKHNESKKMLLLK